MTNSSLASAWAKFRSENGIDEDVPTPEDVQAERTASEQAGFDFLATLADGDEIVFSLTRVDGAKGSLRTKYQVTIDAPTDEGEPGFGSPDFTDLLYLPANLGESLEMVLRV